MVTSVDVTIVAAVVIIGGRDVNIMVTTGDEVVVVAVSIVDKMMIVLISVVDEDVIVVVTIDDSEVIVVIWVDDDGLVIVDVTSVTVMLVERTNDYVLNYYKQAKQTISSTILPVYVLEIVVLSTGVVLSTKK